MNTPNNRRSRNTSEKIAQVVFAMMQEEHKPLGKITVREICARTGIHRSTFYDHYLDVYDVVEKTEQTMAQKLTASFTDQLEHGASARTCFVSLFRFMEANQDFYTLYFRERNQAGVINVAWDLVNKHLPAVRPNDTAEARLERYHYNGIFFLYGITGLVREWVKNGCQETPEELFEILYRQSDIHRHMVSWCDDPDKMP